MAALVVLTACSTPASTAEPSATLPPSPIATPSAAASSAAATPSEAPPASPGVATWTQLTAAGGPAPREDHTWTIDDEGNAAYLFGGRGGDGVAFGDLWAYDLAADTWSQAQAQGPAARFGHEAAWVAGIGLVIFAGQAGTTFFNDLWAFDPDAGQWRELPAAGAVPIPRYGTCAALGPDGRLWISHGFTSEGNRFADTLAYDFDAGSWTDETPVADRPIARCLHGCWWTDDDRFVLYAGQTTGVTALGDLWQLSLGERPGTNAWSQVTTELPPERNLYAKARTDGGTLVFGGQAVDGGYLGGLWSFADAGSGAVTVEVEGTEPPGRAGAELVWDGERLLLFGGKQADGVLGDLWELRLPDA
jgi:Galactose oxidase, central domain